MIDADATVAALAERPERVALLLDFDGSLAPFVELASDARPLPEAVSVLARLVPRLGRVAIVSGRPVAFLAEHLSVDGLALAGLYGMERSIDGRYSVDPRVRPYLVAVAAATAELETYFPPEVVEPKAGLSVTLHWRPAPELAEEILEVARDVAGRHGLSELRTRMAVELRPPVEIDKSDPTDAFVEGFDTGAFAGDDIGDFPAFAALASAVNAGRLRRAVRIGVRSPEAPAELEGMVDIVVDGAAGLIALLSRVADEIGEPVGR
ncbi:MAG TPA: trehalose-phosphatase [Acidimicrobiia bacterium]|nr:trehalose-phosphatase [Acidimicrobiia bacterium]